ncbi:HAMP domain-containing sensor histidine kinase [Clostridium baratii]|uniref:histidine kinase n=1 Tax=Clostridium baratii str. Sullivan TaxID=1415775 RepID=A0A0A7FU14_9CLOT|nr:sensor histidine kinase [Clostridium baratii]AIY83124.1 histidine kinase-, DNA gyrase B-, and HSP90-like ATPase family protein [Clostridium baratii str. Sullivan]CUP50738.1 two-component sensor histidine kinase [Clostridium baratii]
MRFIDYLKDKGVFLIINLGIFLILTIFMSFLNFGSAIISFLFAVWFGPLILYIIIEFIREKRFFNDLNEITENIDKKFLITEILKEPGFIEGKIFYNSLKEANKDMHEHVNVYKNKQKEYKDYIEMWVHEIKTPIASSKLIIENNKNEVTTNIDKELKKIDEMIEQVLYYSKSDEANKDYIVKEFPLKSVVMNAVKKNSRDFIEKRIALELDDISENVFTDVKWVEFIINQIIVNALKYTRQGGKIKISSEKNKKNIVLVIEDNGVGISEKDIKKVFIKGFTGENGRIFGKSTGMGLYLCEKLCKKLGLGIKLTSKQGIGTTIRIVFPQGGNTKF